MATRAAAVRIRYELGVNEDTVGPGRGIPPRADVRR